MRDLLRSGTFWFSVAVVVVLSVGAGLSAVFWGDLTGTGDNKESLSTTVRNVMLMMGGLLALPLAIWRGWVAEQQVKATSDSVNAAHEAISNQRFQAAAQMLGHDLNAVRLSAMHTLVSLSRQDREQYYIQSLRLLAAFVRDPARGDNAQKPKTERDDGGSVREDVSFAIDFIGSRTSDELCFERSQDFAVDLDGVRLVGIDLHGLNLSGVSLRHANLARTICTSTNFSKCDLTFAKFSDASLEAANLRGATLSGTDFSTPHRSMWVVSGAEHEDEPSPARGLIQSQLDEAIYDGQNPPNLRSVQDVETGQLLTWSGESVQ